MNNLISKFTFNPNHSCSDRSSDQLFSTVWGGQSIIERDSNTFQFPFFAIDPNQL